MFANIFCPKNALPSTSKSNLRLSTAKTNTDITALAQLPLTVAGLSNAAHLFADLLSVSNLTNAPNFAEVRFNSHGVGIYKSSSTDGEQLAFYPKEPTDKLWYTSLPENQPLRVLQQQLNQKVCTISSCFVMLSAVARVRQSSTEQSEKVG